MRLQSKQTRKDPFICKNEMRGRTKILTFCAIFTLNIVSEATPWLPRWFLAENTLLGREPVLRGGLWQENERSFNPPSLMCAGPKCTPVHYAFWSRLMLHVVLHEYHQVNLFYFSPWKNWVCWTDHTFFPNDGHSFFNAICSFWNKDEIILPDGFLCCCEGTVGTSYHLEVSTT